MLFAPTLSNIECVRTRPSALSLMVRRFEIRSNLEYFVTVGADFKTRFCDFTQQAHACPRRDCQYAHTKKELESARLVVHIGLTKNPETQSKNPEKHSQSNGPRHSQSGSQSNSFLRQQDPSLLDPASQGNFHSRRGTGQWSPPSPEALRPADNLYYLQSQASAPHHFHGTPFLSSVDGVPLYTPAPVLYQIIDPNVYSHPAPPSFSHPPAPTPYSHPNHYSYSTAPPNPPFHGHPQMAFSVAPYVNGPSTVWPPPSGYGPTPNQMYSQPPNPYPPPPFSYNPYAPYHPPYQ